MVCKRRYSDARKRYENQINKEIFQCIDFHSTASEACFLVRWVTLRIGSYSEDSTLLYIQVYPSRCMAITSLWPPLYNLRELRSTSRYFCSLKPKEKARLNFIMHTDIIWRQEITFSNVFKNFKFIYCTLHIILYIIARNSIISWSGFY